MDVVVLENSNKLTFLGGSLQIINAVISSIGMHGGVPFQGGAGSADNTTTVSNIRSAYFMSTPARSPRTSALRAVSGNLIR